MKAAGINPSAARSPGQDAELAGIQRILAGEQYMTVYKAIKPRGRGRRRPSPWRWLKGEDRQRRDHAGRDNGTKDVPSVDPRRRSP